MNNRKYEVRITLNLMETCLCDALLWYIKDSTAKKAMISVSEMKNKALIIHAFTLVWTCTFIILNAFIIKQYTINLQLFLPPKHFFKWNLCKELARNDAKNHLLLQFKAPAS